MSGRLVTVFGGSGFIGRYVVERLAAAGNRVRVAVRRPNGALFLKPLGAVGQIQLVATNVRDPESVARAVEGSDAVVNLVGILAPSGSQTFEALQEEGAGLIARTARAAGVRALTHVSAIGASTDSMSNYAVTKARGEQAVLAAFPGATILRPSLVIGHEDGFFNKFAKLAALLPVLPVPGCDTKFQPVYVGDVADAVVTSIAEHGHVRGIYELGGPEVMTLRGLLERLLEHIDRSRPIINVPFGLATFQATFLGLLPNPPLTRDQVELLKSDNIVSEGAKTLSDMGLVAQPIDAILPRYTVHYKPKGQFGS